MWGYQESMEWRWMIPVASFLVTFILLFFGTRLLAHVRDGFVVPPETPLMIAQKRFARGEISKRQFEALRKVLGSEDARDDVITETTTDEVLEIPAPLPTVPKPKKQKVTTK